MPIFALTNELVFPPPNLADEHGIVAIGGDLRPERLLLAYQEGIFPWPHEGYPLLWFSPHTRFVLSPSEIHIGRSLQKVIRKNPYEIRFDTCFREVMQGCQQRQRPGQDGTWISDDMIEAYTRLHEMGLAHSAEAYEKGALVGGVYGVSIGRAFFGESMFAIKPDASKIAFATLVAHLCKWQFDLVDCQTETSHLARFGAYAISQKKFLKALRDSHNYPTLQGCWECSMQPPDAFAYLVLAAKDISR